MSPKSRRLRRALVTGGLVVGASLGAAGIATAATGATATAPGPSSSAPSAGTQGAPPNGQAADPATMAHGPNETLLTGSDLEKATAAAEAALPGATIIRAETNSSGASPYEVHMRKSDGSEVTVELDSNFAVVATVSGFGGGPAGTQAPSGAPSSSASSY